MLIKCFLTGHSDSHGPLEDAQNGAFLSGVQYLKPQSFVNEEVIFFYIWMKRNYVVVLTSGQKIGDWKPG